MKSKIEDIPIGSTVDAFENRGIEVTSESEEENSI